MITDVGALGAGAMGLGPPEASRGVGGAMGKEEFLQLLVAQLSNQDPLNPMQAEEFAAQLAQFAQVEQLIELNATGKMNQAAMTALALAQNNATAAQVLGKEVLAAGEGFTIPEEGSPRITVAVGGEGGSATLVILNAAGQEVGRESLGFLASGRHDLEPGRSVEGLEPGSYRYRLEVMDGDGAPVQVQTFTRALVEGVRYGPQGPVLLVGGEEIPLGDVLEIVEPAR